MLKKPWASLVVVAAFLVCTNPASAAPLTVKISGFANSGSIGDIEFGGVNYVLTGVGNLANLEVVERSIGDITRLPFDSVSIDIQGVGIFTITSPMRFFQNDNTNRVGVGRVPVEDETGTDRFSFFPNDIFSSEVFSFDERLTYTGSMALLQWNVTSTRQPVLTEAGILTFGNRTDPSATLEIIPIPIPAAWVMLASALGLLGWLGRRRAGSA
ncbi:MAG: hypothetical protein JJT85_10835 [Chromatiales bacterium]|nr:hypothetical protein [Chromatiales bacterium]